MPKFTVIGVYISEDGAVIADRFADLVTARTWQEAEREVRRKRGDDAVIAATLAGAQSPVDTDQGSKEGYCAECSVKHHEMCSLTPGCPCCDDTIAQTADGE